MGEGGGGALTYEKSLDRICPHRKEELQLATLAFVKNEQTTMVLPNLNVFVDSKVSVFALSEGFNSFGS